MSTARTYVDAGEQVSWWQITRARACIGLIAGIATTRSLVHLPVGFLAFAGAIERVMTFGTALQGNGKVGFWFLAVCAARGFTPRSASQLTGARVIYIGDLLRCHGVS